MAENDSFGFLLGETARTWRNHLDQRLKPLGMSQARWLVLVHLNRAGSDMTQRELSERLGIEGPSLVRLLDRMETDGWVERRVATHDRRAKTVHPTAKAGTMIRRIKRIAADLRGEVLAGIPAADLATASAVLERIKHRMEQL